jgi:hypothetical protein
VLGKYLKNQQDFPSNRFFALQRISGDGKDIFIHTVDFYSGQIQPLFLTTETLVEAVGKEKAWIYLDAQGLEELKKLGEIKILRAFDKYHVTQLTPLFLNPQTRLEATNKVFLVEFVNAK